MGKNRENWRLAGLMAVILAVGLLCYGFYIRKQFYDEGISNLQEIYEQVNKTFTIFTQRNWNVLSEWGESLQTASAEGRTVEQLESFEAERNTWQYSGVYLFNEDCEYWSTRNKHNKVEHLWTAFEEMYRTGEPTVSSYVMTNGERRVVFAVPIDPVEIDGKTYTCLAVSYKNSTIEELIGGHSYNGQSDCYIVYPSGNVMLSEEPKSEIEAWMENLFDYLEQNTKVKPAELSAARQGVETGGTGSLLYRYEGRSYYLVYRPVGFQDLSIIGIVSRDAVDSGMRKIQNATILLLLVLFASAAAVLVWSIKRDARFRVQEKECALRQEEQARQQMEGLANTDGLTGLYNERYFNALLKEKARRQEPFVLFYLDLDRFKPVNDIYGHDVGDQLLREVANRLRGCVREDDYVFRIGGDEFALILNGAMTREFCGRRIEKIKAAIREPFVLKAATVQVGTSCGCASFPSESGDAREIRILADQRMYEDKQRSGQSREH